MTSARDEGGREVHQSEIKEKSKKINSIEGVVFKCESDSSDDFKYRNLKTTLVISKDKKKHRIIYERNS